MREAKDDLLGRQATIARRLLDLDRRSKVHHEQPRPHGRGSRGWHGYGAVVRRHIVVDIATRSATRLAQAQLQHRYLHLDRLPKALGWRAVARIL
jgi:hypothetical protein